MASRKILKEFKDMKNDPITSFNVGPVDEDMFHWEATITGAPDSPYAGGVFLIDIRFPNDYPFKEPKVVFKTKVFHLSISRNGFMWLDFMDEGWSPSMTISKVLISICERLTNPKPENVLQPEMAEMYKTDRPKYESTARSWTQQYAMA